MAAPVLHSASQRVYNAKELAEVAGNVAREVFKEVYKHNASGSVPTNNPLYGPYSDGSGDYGILSQPGIRPTIFSAFQRPRSFSSLLGIQRSLNTNEKIGIMTGVTTGGGSNPTGFCGTAPTGGQLKLCKQNYIFGRSFWKSQLVNVAESGETVDYSDSQDRRVLNLQQNPNPLLPADMSLLDLSERNIRQAVHSINEHLRERAPTA